MTSLPADPREVVCEALGRHLAALSGAPLFGLAGSCNLELIGAFRAAGGTYHAACHEAGVVAMAGGWAQASGAGAFVDAKVDPRADAAGLMTPLGAAGWSLAPRSTQGTPA